MQMTHHRQVTPRLPMPGGTEAVHGGHGSKAQGDAHASEQPAPVGHCQPEHHVARGGSVE